MIKTRVRRLADDPVPPADGRSPCLGSIAADAAERVGEPTEVDDARV